MAKFELLTVRLEGVRRIQQIHQDLRALHSAVLIGHFATEGEVGYVPQKEVDHGMREVMPYYETRWYFPFKEKLRERQSAIENLSHIED